MAGKRSFGTRERMRYRFLMELFGLRLDKKRFARDFGDSIERGLAIELAYMRAFGRVERDDADSITLTAGGR